MGVGWGKHIQKTQHEIINIGNSFMAYKPSKNSAPNKGIYFASQHQVAISLDLSIMLQPTVEIPPAFLKLQPNSCFSNHKRIPETFGACDVHHTKLGVTRQASLWTVFLVFVHLGRVFGVFLTIFEEVELLFLLLGTATILSTRNFLGFL